jgi:peptide subunit release factor 1 (eRF1)
MLAIFSSASESMFEVARLRRPTDARVVIDRRPYVEPLLEAAEGPRWCVALVDRRSSRILAGTVGELSERARIDDAVHGKHDQGGWSQANYRRSIEKDVDDHLRRVAAALADASRREPFDRLCLGGATEAMSRIEGMLGEDIQARLVRPHLPVDVAVTDAQLRDAVGALAEQDERRLERERLDELAAGIGSGDRAAGGATAVIAALNRRGVDTLLLDREFDRAGGACPRCGLLALRSGGTCPVDGSELEPLDHLREAAVEAALTQDAEVMIVRWHPDLGPLQGIAALLRF